MHFSASAREGGRCVLPHICSIISMLAGRTEVHQFDASLRGQQDVVPLHVAVDGLVGVQVLEALRGHRSKPWLPGGRSPPPLTTPRRAHHEGLVEDVGDDGLVHPLPPPQQAFGQIRYRAAVAQLRRQDGRKG